MSTDIKANNKVKQEQMKKQDHEIVKGVFKNYEVPGGVLRFSFKKYKEDSVSNWEFYDNTIYSIPRMIAKHLTSNCWYPEYENNVIQQGALSSSSMEQPVPYRVRHKVRRFGFQSLEFMDDEMNPKVEILQVEKA